MITESEKIITKPDRIDAVDALRGFALLGVGIAHILEQNAGAAHTAEIVQAAAATLPDQVIQGIHQVLVSGKFYVLFSLLFGLSFYIQIDRPHIDKSMQRGVSTSSKFVWRLAILLLFGYLHHLFYRGDILMLYAVLGLSLPLLSRLSTRTLLIGAGLLFLGLGRFISFGLMGDSLTMYAAESPENQAYFATLKHGSLLEVFAINNIDGIRNLLAFQFGIFGRGYVTLGLFMAGICLGRSGIIGNLGGHKATLKKTMVWTSMLVVVSFVLMFVAFSQIEQPQTMSTWMAAVALTFYDIFNLSMSAVFACAFLLLVTNRKAILHAFAPYGRMALTNYLLQSLIGTFIFYGWGLGQLGEWPNRYILLLAVILAMGLMWMSAVWLRYFHYGPCEWLWRTLMLRKKVTLRKKPILQQSTGYPG